MKLTKGFVILIVISVLSACNSSSLTPNNAKSSSKVEATLAPTATPLKKEEDTNLSSKLTLDKEFLRFATEGKIKGIEFGIGANKNDVIKKWGEPQEIGSWQTEFYRWSSYYFFFWKPDENTGAIRVYGNVIPYRLNEVRQSLGEPSSEGEGVDGGWAFVYQAGDYQVFLNADSKEGQITNLLLKKK